MKDIVVGIFGLFLAETKPSDEFLQSCADRVRRLSEEHRRRIEDEFEVTPEMIEDGAEEILAAYGGLDLSPCPSVVAERVYLAMRRLACAKEQNPSGHG